MGYSWNFRPIWLAFDVLLNGVWLTISITTAVIILGTIIGIFGALMLRSRFAAMRWIVKAYVEAIRNTPFLAQLFFIYFGLPGIGIKLDSLTASILTLILNLGAYVTEIVRGGLDAVPTGQTDAGLALGLSPIRVFFRIILMQALKTMFPALAGQYTLMMLGTSVVSQIGTAELFYGAQLIDSNTYRSFEVYLVMCGLYLLLTLGLRGGFAVIYWWLFREREPHAVVQTP